MLGPERVDAVLRWADHLACGAEPTHQLFSAAGRPSIAAATYCDVPWPGWTFGITYGASLVFPVNIEFVTVVQNRSALWTWAVADFVDHHRTDANQVGLGDTINWHEPIDPTSSMDALAIVSPMSMDQGSDLIHLADDDHIQLLQVIPIHASELDLFRRLGADGFLGLVGNDCERSLKPVIGDHRKPTRVGVLAGGW